MATYWLNVRRLISPEYEHRVNVFSSTDDEDYPDQIINGDTYSWLRDKIRDAISRGEVVVRPGYFDGFYVHLSPQGILG